MPCQLSGAMPPSTISRSMQTQSRPSARSKARRKISAGSCGQRVCEMALCRIASLIRSSKPSGPHSSLSRSRAAPSTPLPDIASVRTARRARCSTSAWPCSSSTSKRAGTLASNGNKCSNRSQKAWIVWIFNPPGVSSVRAKSLRAARKSPLAGSGAPTLMISALRSPSASWVHFASLSKTPEAIFAAAALVKVRQRSFEGATPCSRSRITRLASTWVLPEPALAETHTDWSGLEALCCLPSVSCGIS